MKNLNEVLIKENMTTEEKLALVEQIHHEFEYAGAAVVKDVNSFEKENKHLLELDELARAGFSGSKEVAENREKIEEYRSKKAYYDEIRKYEERYPMNKFIRPEDLDNICEKYGLLFGADKHYKNTIPEKNRKEIINFKLNEEDVVYYKGVERLINHDRANRTAEAVIEWSEIPKKDYLRETDNGANLMQRNVHYISNKDYYTIVAPEKDFDFKDAKVFGSEVKQVKKVKLPIEDPIVLKTVRHGYLVVSMWGEEAYLPEVQNGKLN